MFNKPTLKKNEAVDMARKSNIYVLLLPDKAVEHKSIDAVKAEDILITHTSSTADQSRLMRRLGLHPSYTLSI